MLDAFDKRSATEGGSGSVISGLGLSNLLFKLRTISESPLFFRNIKNECIPPVREPGLAVSCDIFQKGTPNNCTSCPIAR
jgi:hypothetical protein